MPVADHTHSRGADVTVLSIEELVEQSHWKIAAAERLVEPERFQLRPFVRRLRVGPGIEIGADFFAPFVQNPASLFPDAAVGGQQELKQLAVFRLQEVRSVHQAPALCRDAPDAAVNAIATRITKIDLTMVDDRVGPIRNVERAVRSDLHIDRAKSDIRAAKQVRHLARDVCGLLLFDGETNNAVRSEIAGDHIALPL